MLTELAIKNFAIIDDLRIRFDQGLTILTGETGAGKSIIINAVNLLLGSRAASSLVRKGADQAELEAEFLLPMGSRAAEIMDENDMDPAQGLIIRRIISKNNRHKIYLNGRLSTIQVLSQITENLASISGQHAHQGLLNEDLHLLLLDQLGGLVPLRRKISGVYHTMVPLIKKLGLLKKRKKHHSERLDLLEFQKKEIQEAELTPNEDADLEQERKKLKHGEDLYKSIMTAIQEIYDSNGSLFERMGKIKEELIKAQAIDPVLEPEVQALSGILFEAEDVAARLRTYLKTIEMDETRLELVEARLDHVNKMKRKYGGSIEAVTARLHEIDDELNCIENLDQEIISAKEAMEETRKEMELFAIEISEKRTAAAEKFSKMVERELVELKMEGAKFQIQLRSIPWEGSGQDSFLSAQGKLVDETGFDKARFMMAPNIGEDFKPLASIASGGELSRVILALKAILAKKESVETVVFDEVDAGIGGGVAEMAGRKMASLSKYHQIICITHLPQIARFGDHHFRISKNVSEGRTVTNIQHLDMDKRIDEIARMLGGEKITKATIDHAREMLAMA